MTATIIRLADRRKPRRPPPPLAPATLAVACLLWWSAVLQVAAQAIARQAP